MELSFVLVAAPAGDPVLSLRTAQASALSSGSIGIQINGASVPGPFATAATPAGLGILANSVIISVSLPASAFVQGANTVSIALQPNSPSVTIDGLAVAIDPSTYLKTTPTVG